VVLAWFWYQSQDVTQYEHPYAITRFSPTSTFLSFPPRTLPLQQLQPAHENFLKVVEDSRAEVAALAATVTEMRDTIKRLSARNGGLRNELQKARKKFGENTRAAITPPPPPTTPAPPPRAPSKRKRTGPQAPHQPAKQARDTSPAPTLMHSKHAGPSVTTVPVQLPPTTSEPPR
jgi:uncharacterized coiled-coil protein SlyX